jgi:hypothetical protein
MRLRQPISASWRVLTHWLAGKTGGQIDHTHDTLGLHGPFVQPLRLFVSDGRRTSITLTCGH